MPNIASVLKDEITRLARREIRKETQKLKKASAQYRRDIAELKRQLSDSQRRLALVEEQVFNKESLPVEEEPDKTVRFTAQGLRSQRKRLGFSAKEYAKLAGVSLQSIYNWEHEVSRPRKQQIAVLAALRGIGKKEALVRLEQLEKKKSRKKRS